MGKLTFRGGIHPYEGKELSKDHPIEKYLPKGDLVYPLSQHIGAPSVPCVKKGDTVLAGQKIADAGGFVSVPLHASVSGTVKGIEKRLNATGSMVDCIVIENDQQYQETEFQEARLEDLTKEEMLAYLAKVELTLDPETNEIVAPTFRQDIHCMADVAEEVARFFGYEINTRRSMDHTRTRSGLQRRSWLGTIVLKVSYETVLKRLQSYDAVLITQVNRKETLKPSSRKYMVNRQDADILAQYNLELRGFYNYYSIADNIGYFGWKFNYFMKYSMLKTLGRKHKRTVGQILEKYKNGTDVIIPYKDSKGNAKQRVWYNGGFRCKRFTGIYEDNHYDYIPNTMYLPTLVERLKERIMRCNGRSCDASHT